MKVKKKVKMFLDRNERLGTLILKLHHERIIFQKQILMHLQSRRCRRNRIPGTLRQILMEMMKVPMLIVYQILLMSHKEPEEAEKLDNQKGI
jgi:hypothetical protein